MSQKIENIKKDVEQTTTGSMLDRLEQRISDKKLKRAPVEDALEKAAAALVVAKKAIDNNFIATATPEALARLTNAWLAWDKTEGIFTGDANKDLRNSLQPLLKKDSAAARYARQIWRTEMMSVIAKGLHDNSTRTDKEEVMVKLLESQKVDDKEDEPHEALRSAMWLDPAIKSKSRRDALAKEMVASTKTGKITDIGTGKALGKAFGVNEVKVVVGGALMSFDRNNLELAQKFEFKNMVLDEKNNRAYAQMKNGCEGNLVIIELSPSQPDKITILPPKLIVKRPGEVPGPTLVRPGETPGPQPQRPNEVPGPNLTRPGETPGPQLVRPGEVPGPTLVRPGETPGPQLVRPGETPGPTLTRPGEVHGPQLTRPGETPGPQLKRPGEVPGPTLVRPGETPGPQPQRPNEVPGPNLTRPGETPGPQLVRPGEVPGPTLVRPGETPGPQLQRPNEVPGPNLTRPGETPGPQLVKPGEVPGPQLKRPGEVPGPTLVRPGETPGPQLVRPGEVPGPTLVRPGETPGPQLVRPGETPGPQPQRPNEVPGPNLTRPGETPGPQLVRPGETPGPTLTRPGENPGPQLTRPGENTTRPTPEELNLIRKFGATIQNIVIDTPFTFDGNPATSVTRQRDGTLLFKTGDKTSTYTDAQIAELMKEDRRPGETDARR